MNSFIEIEEITELEEQEDVYDITVENNHNFFANGLLVHNCLGGVLAQDFWENREKDCDVVLGAMMKTANELRAALDNFYLELQWIAAPEQHEYNQYLIELAKLTGIPLVSTADSHYPSPDKWKDRTLYKKLNPRFIQQEAQKPFPETVDEVGYELYPKNGDQMWEAFIKYSKMNNVEYNEQLIRESIERTHEIAFGEIEDFLPDSTVRLPEFVVPEGKTDDEALRELAFKHLASMGISDDDEGSQRYIDQLNHELKVIADRGFSKYFLTMKSASDEAQKMMLSGPGRGSASGALLSYVLGITQVDPLRWDLSFARFLRSDATDYPDIDFDVSSPMELKDHLIEKWGENNVVPISNWNTLQPRSLIKDIARFYGIPHTEANSVTSIMEREATPAKKKELGITAGVVTLNFDDLKKHSPTLIAFLEKYPQVSTHLNELYGQIKSCFSDRSMVLTNNGYKLPQEINVNDDKIAYVDIVGEVMYNEDYELIFNGEKQIFAIELEDGTSIELTEDHEVFTTKGIKQVKDLTDDDCIISVLG